LNFWKLKRRTGEKKTRSCGSLSGNNMFLGEGQKFVRIVKDVKGRGGGSGGLARSRPCRVRVLHV